MSCMNISPIHLTVQIMTQSEEAANGAAFKLGKSPTSQDFNTPSTRSNPYHHLHSSYEVGKATVLAKENV